MMIETQLWKIFQTLRQNIQAFKLKMFSLPDLAIFYLPVILFEV